MREDYRVTVIDPSVSIAVSEYEKTLGDKAALDEDCAVKIFDEKYNLLYTKLVSLFSDMSEEERLEGYEKGRREFLSRVITTKAASTWLTEDIATPWVEKTDIKWNYFSRYRNYLEKKGWSLAAIRSIDDSTKSVLDYLGNPKGDSAFERRGLVVASVQSGKTANYIGLISRAADAGYRVVVLLAGVLDALRNQTQVRVDEGFVEAGFADPQIPKPISFTSKRSDFNESYANSIMAMDQYNHDCPMLFVVKKNASILKNVYSWIKENVGEGEPILLIDDEADNASINVSYHKKKDDGDNSPSAINGYIRKILSTSSRSAYVGYTATPYANIFIDPSEPDDDCDLGADLYPKNFIYTLGDSSDYFGARKLFTSEEEGGARERHLRLIDDANDWLPSKQKDYYVVDDMPASLEKAIRAFVLATAIRAINGQGDSHASMLVNVTPMKQIQQDVCYVVKDYLGKIKNDLIAFGYMGADAEKQSPLIRLLKETYEEEYSTLDGVEWHMVLRAMADGVRDIRVVLRNSDSNDVLNYGDAPEKVIVVGGYALSRGLTLEGLVISYYLRNARAYDTLMQMCRWFGYRGGYEGLCRVWMTEESAAWYEDVAEATDSLYDEFRHMSQSGESPRYYKLRVRTSPFALRVTAPDKSGAMEQHNKVHFDGELVETTVFDLNRLEETIENARNLVSALEDGGYALAPAEDLPIENKGMHIVENVPVEIVRGFLGRSESCGASLVTGNKPLLSYIDDPSDEKLALWDIVFVSGDGKSRWFEVPGGEKLRSVKRSAPQTRLTEGLLRASGKSRLGSARDERAGLTEDLIEEAKREARERGNKQTPGHLYRLHRSKPLLTVYPLEVFAADGEENDDWPKHAVGWGVSSPLLHRPVEDSYAVNKIVEFDADEIEEELDEE